MQITVILCTYNRCRDLRTALDSVAASELSGSVKWDVLVVDNNSRDQTRQVVEDFSSRYPGRFRYLFEPKPGKSNALNAGIREAGGDVLAFIDDDVTVERSWLWNLTAALEEKQWAGAGGPVLPLWNSPRPNWLPCEDGESLAPFVYFNPGSEPGELKEPPFGTNMAFRKEMFTRYGGFRTDLGPRPGSEIRAEDTEFGRRLLNGGERLRYEPSAVVYHPVSPERLTRKYLLDWWLAKGRANALEFGPEAGTRYLVGGIPVYLLKRLAGRTLRWMLTVDPGLRFDRKRGVWCLIGEILEHRSQCHRKEAGARPVQL